MGTAPAETKLVCRIELKKEAGITIKVVDDKGKITQTIVMDGKVIKLTCQGEKNTSTITQKPDGIDIQCKTFTLKAETIDVTSTKATTHKSEDALTIQSTKAMTIKTDDALSATAAKDFTAKGMNLTAKADSKTEISGMNVDVKATSAMKISGLTTELSGQTQVEVKGAPTIKVSSSGILDLQGQMTTLGGQMTNVKGSLIKLG